MMPLTSSENTDKNGCAVKIYLLSVDMSIFMVYMTYFAHAQFEVTARHMKSFV